MDAQSQETITSHNKIGQIIPPDNEKNNFKVVYAQSPNSFWVVHPGEDDAIQDVIDAAAEVRGGHFRTFKDTSELRLGIVCFANFEGDWYRARVEKIEKNSQGVVERVTVWFIDYGNTEVIKDMGDVRKIDHQLIKDFKQLVTTPGQAMECTLTSVGPNPLRNHGSDSVRGWDEFANDTFRDLLEETKVAPQDDLIRADIYSVVKKNELTLMSLTVYDQNGETLNTKMLKAVDPKGNRLAKAEQEGLLSQDDHELRRRRRDATATSEIRSTAAKGDMFKMTEEMTNLVIEKINKQHEKYRSVAMSGPFHPLELRLAAIHRQGYQMQTRVEPDSVNSVLLDNLPNDKYDHWMVAANVSLNQKQETLVLRSTTFMPPTGGLGALLAMVFAPRVELICDKKFTHYTGCLLGLGDREKGWGLYAGKTDRCPYYAAHDAELRFDFELKDADVININKARHALSRALSRESSGKRGLSPAQMRAEIPANLTVDDKLFDMREDLQAALNSLVDLNNQRHLKDKTPFAREYHWKGIADSRFVPIQLAGWQDHIFPSVSKIKLSGSHDSMLKQLEALKEWAENPSYTTKMIAAKAPSCPICGSGQSVVFHSKRDITDHLFRDRNHKDNLQALLTEVRQGNH